MSRSPASSLSLKWLLMQILALFSWVVESRSLYFCSRAVYNSPLIPDCAHALAALPRADEYYRYYVEPQLETNPREADWQGWIDERPLQLQRTLIQVPKFWSYGTCNLALMSYVDGHPKRETSLSRWADIYLAGYTLMQACLNLHSQGGAATIGDINYPTLTMFVWENGAAFDATMNKYMTAGFPAGIDPRFPAILKTWATFNSSADTLNGTVSEGIEIVSPVSLLNSNVLKGSPGLSPNATGYSILAGSS